MSFTGLPRGIDMNIYFSKTTNGFYNHDLKDLYDSAKNWQDDAVKIDDETYLKYLEQPPEGKMLGGDDRGYPVWIDKSHDDSETMDL